MTTTIAVPATTPPAEPGHRGARLDWRVRFLLLAVIWGLSFVFIKIGTQALAPLQVTLGRMVVGAGTLLAVLAARREPLPRGRRVWAHLTVAAVLLNVVPFTLFAAAEQRVSSVLAGIANATTPLFTVLVALLALPEERPTRQKSAGLAVGFAGVLVVLGAWRGLGGGRDLVGTLLALAAAGCYGLGWAYIRRYLAGSGQSSLALSAGQLLAGTVQLAVLTPILTTTPARLPVRVVLAVGALGVLGTGIAYVLQYGLIRDAGATTAATVTYLIPVVSTLAGVVLLGEQLTWNQPLGAAVIVAGAALSQRQRHTPSRPPPDPAPDPAQQPAAPPLRIDSAAPSHLMTDRLPRSEVAGPRPGPRHQPPGRAARRRTMRGHQCTDQGRLTRAVLDERQAATTKLPMSVGTRPT
jgi:drug/metabolite transporter (DMT)-like permease